MDTHYWLTRARREIMKSKLGFLDRWEALAEIDALYNESGYCYERHFYL